MTIAISTLDTIRENLINRYGHAVDVEVINEKIENTWEAHAAAATIMDYLPVLVERDVAEQLEEEGAQRVTRIVFVGAGSRSLAGAAAAVAQRLADNVTVAITGTHPEMANNEVLERTFSDHGYDIDAVPMTWSTGRTIHRPDVVVYLEAEDLGRVSARREMLWDIADKEVNTSMDALRLLNTLEAYVMEYLPVSELPTQSPIMHD